MKNIKFIALFLVGGIISYGFTPLSGDDGAEKIKWHTFTEAVELSKKQKKKIFIDVYTDWCGPCKMMAKNTLTHPFIVKYINEHFYAVKLNAEMKDTVVFNNMTFINPNPNLPRSTHQLAASLATQDNKLMYPTIVYLDENINLITRVQGYLLPDQIEPVLKWISNGTYLTTSWNDFMKTFKGEIPPPAPPVTPPH